MQPFSLSLSEDRTRLTLTIATANAAEPVELSVDAVDRLIRDLAECRSSMHPVHSAEPPERPHSAYTADNLLWYVRAAPHVSALELGIQHPGLGWITMPMSRAQVEDLETSIEFSMRDVKPVRPEGSE